MANKVRRNCTDDSEFVRAKSEYFNYLLRAGYNISNIDNAFQNVQLSQETLVRNTKENQVNIANTPYKKKCITSFKVGSHHPISIQLTLKIFVCVMEFVGVHTIQLLDPIIS